MPEPKLERIIAENQIIWRVTYLGMSRDFNTDWQAAGFYHDLWLAIKNTDNLTRQ